MADEAERYLSDALCAVHAEVLRQVRRDARARIYIGAKLCWILNGW